MAALVLFLVLLALGAASLLGRTTDSRDPAYDLGCVVGRSAEPGANPQAGRS